MSYRSIFGQDLTEYEIDILVDSGIQASQWEAITQRSQQYAQRYGPQRTAAFVKSLLRNAGVAVGTIAALTKAATTRQPTNKQDGKRLREGEDNNPVPSKFQKPTVIRDDAEPRSLPNLTETQQARIMPEGTGSGNDAGLSETPVDQVGDVFRGPPNYTFASLPWFYDRVDETSAAMSSTWAFRMTSPYDVSVTASFTDDNAGAGTTNNTLVQVAEPDSGAQNARWFTFYAGMYKYYHVVSCKWHLTVENLSTDPLYCHIYYANEVDRPRLATNRDMLLWSDIKSHLLGPVAYAIDAAGTVENMDMVDNAENSEVSPAAGVVPNYETGNMVTPKDGKSNFLVTSGSYKPGQYNRDIRLDSEVENWTSVTTNPALSERLYFRVKPQWDAQNLVAGDATTYGRPMKYRWTIKTEFLVEFKELVDGLKYPIQDQPITVTISQLQGSK